MSVRVSCPGCGGPVVFAVGSSLVTVCPSCRAAVARADRGVENLGKVAELVETGAVLRVGLEGKLEGQRFQLTGRTQLAHEAGGVWDEWYAAFPNDRWGWLAEAQGRYYLTFEKPDAADLPAFDALHPGRPAGVGKFTVAETGQATVRGAEGEIPYRLVPGSTYAFADLSGPKKTFATLAYDGDVPTLYAGREVTLDELHIPRKERRETHQLREVGGRKLGCPNCGGALALRAPDQTKRVGCPYCGSLLDCKEGDLKLLNALKDPPFPLVLPLGSVGKFGDEERTVIGALLRSVTYDGTDYFWQEYLLYHPRDGFEWLIWAENHWTRLKNVSTGDVTPGAVSAVYDGKRFRKFREADATVRGVLGECYWKVQVGEVARAAEYIHPPYMLTVEESTAGHTREVNWTMGEYLTPAQVQAAFDLPEPLPPTKGVAPNQVFPYSRIYLLALAAVGMLALLGILMSAAPTHKVHEQTFQLQPLVAEAPPPQLPGQPPPPPTPPDRTQVFFTDLFELKGGRNVRVTVTCPNLSGWLVVEGDLVQQSSGQVQPFLVPLTMYSGVTEGEAWSEGSRENSVYVSAQPAGQYSLRLEVEREQPLISGPLTVRLEQGAARGRNWILTCIGLLLIPAGVLIYHMIFAGRRWADADYTMFGTEK